VRVATGFLALLLGLVLAFADLFLAIWADAAHGAAGPQMHSDWFWLAFGPYGAAATGLMAVGASTVVLHRRGASPAPIVSALLVAGTISYLALRLDRTATAWRVLGTIHLAVGWPGYIALRSVLPLIGCAIVIVSSKPHPERIVARAA
jgi:hypothetical protein